MLPENRCPDPIDPMDFEEGRRPILIKFADRFVICIIKPVVLYMYLRYLYYILDISNLYSSIMFVTFP